MNRVPFTLHAGDNLLQYPGHNETKGSLARSFKDIKPNDIKSPSKLASNSGTARNLHHSSSELFSRIAPSIKQTKSPTHRPRPVVFSIENFESKENCSFEAKATSMTRLTAKKAISDLNANKSTAATNSAIAGKSNISSQVQTHRNKSPQYELYEGFTHRKPTKIEPSAYGSLILTQRDVKAYFPESTKKSNLPSSLKLTLDKICKKESSSTHRVVVNSPTAETSGKLTHQKSVNELGLEPKARAGNVEKNTKNSNAKHKLNTMLVGLTKPIGNHGKTSSRQSARNGNSVSGTPRNNYSGAYSIEEENETMKKYKKLLGVLKEKNKEIKRLSHDKSELQCTLSMMKEEITSLRKEKTVSKNKEDSLVDSQLEDSRVQSSKNIEKSRPFSPNMIHSMSLYQKSMIDLSNGDIKPVKLIASPRGAFGKNTQGVSERAGKTWMSSIDNRMLKGRKRSDNADGSMENMQFGGKSSSYISSEQNMLENSFKLRNENYSHKEKLSYLKEIDEEFEDNHKKRQNEDLLRVTIDINSPLQGDNYIKKTKKGNFEKKERDNISLDDRTLFRTSSTDPKSRLEKQLIGKNSGINSSMAYFSMSNTSQGEGMDIGGALNELKGRIKKMLVKRNEEDNTKAQLKYEDIYERLQKIA